MSKSKNAQRTAWLVLILLIVIVIAATIFLSKGFREYLRDYEQFQQYKEYMQALESGDNPDSIGNGEDGNGIENQPEVSDNQPTAPDIQGGADTNPSILPDNIGTNGGEVAGPVLEGGQDITDVSGNVLWQANMVTEEEAALIRSYVEERNEVYTWANSYEKTMKINELDNLILDVAACTFPNVQINFVGDSITEGVGGAVDANGEKISYVNYVQEELQFGNVINNGLAGRMIAAYTINTGFSMEENHEGLFDRESEIVVFYMGLNDYLAPEEVKNFGVIDYTTGGYRGQLHQWVQRFAADYPNTEFFFVTAYQTPLPNPTQQNINFDGVPTLNDYMEPQRMLAAQYGYPVIELYGTGFMDMNDALTAENLLADSTHPNDTGYRILGEHIAAEIVLYYLGIS